MSNIKVSVIIPVYNVELYLSECLDSLINQTLKEIEIICVDDGSTDKSLDILEEYEKKDSRITVIHQQNQYAGVARNNGLKIAKGDYVIFLDSDDFFDLQLLEKTYTKATETSADIILFDAIKYDTKKQEYQKASHYFRKEFVADKESFSRKDLPDDFLRITSPCPWTKLFKREFVINNKLWFQNLHNSNDVYFVLVALCLAEKISHVDEELVYYRTNVGNNLQSTKSKHYHDFFDAYEAVYEELNKRGIYKDVEKSFVNIVISGCIYNLNSAKNDLIKQKIYLNMLASDFTKMNLLGYPEEYYWTPANVSRLKGANLISEWLEKQKRKDNEFEILLDKRNELNFTPVISVIIPVYNVEAYLEECLDSIVNQSLSQIEIICIDDGSTDVSLDILTKYAEKDLRIVVCTQKNSGQSAARNMGIKNASGKYLYFMDSDDILDFSALEILYKKMEEERLDILYFDGTSFAESLVSDEIFESYKTYYIRSKTYDNVQTGEKLMTDMKSNGDYRVSPCMQMINRKFFYDNDLWFCNGILYEDNLYTFKSMMCAQKTCHISNQLYHRRVRNNSTMTGETHFANTYGYFRCYLGMYDIYKEVSFNNEETELLVLNVINAVLSSARNTYKKISTEEKQIYYALSTYERNLFKTLIIDANIEEIKSVEKKLKVVWAEKSEINRKLKQTYAEKSELNRKLQQTYKEKAERGIEIKNLKNQLNNINNSTSYKIGKIITWLPRRIKRLFIKTK